ncbi:tRNA threonylcarbamoyladenosine dehydratase [Prevotella sp. oral taxon 475]|uniref:tRNA threonylcarbamoyladenosine dehydratase n=1 Tax=Prevotella sp. oral taxon 475 TaxID=712471 RepID=UPI001BAB46DA|nr:tRNA threonylcarbamoyladenosine dehydratase [Prevotella sp. oral taxon 475]QUB46581.1 tRNA threonylcarbamoyladenosine dehydratase [Prevotella sp. oral taxon 475]
MQNQFSRTRMLLGTSAMKALERARVAVFGMGGVGGYAVEVLARSGIGTLEIFDDDRVCPTNINRQLYALLSTVGRHKVDVAEERIRDINSSCQVHKHRMFYMPQNADEVDLSQFDYVVDCIDTVTAKLELIRRCHHLRVPLISCMGAAYKLDATAFRVADIYQTKIDPLAKVIRKKLRKMDIHRLKVVYSEEEPLLPVETETNVSSASAIGLDDVTQQPTERRKMPASNAFVPAAAGIIVGAEVVKDLIKIAQNQAEEGKTPTERGHEENLCNRHFQGESGLSPEKREENIWAK